MHISGISVQDPVSGGTTGATKELGKDAFMSLLVEQLRNQDPLKPTANQEFIAELASFSSLEQMEQLNENLLGMVILQQSNALLSQLTEGSALIGKQVRYFDQATQAVKEGSVDSVKVEEGLALLNVDGRDVPLSDVTEIVGALQETATEQ